jgi:catechol-2,3-dioxygenase
MQRDLISFIRCSILSLAGCVAWTVLPSVNAFADEQGAQPATPPKIDHILLEVTNLKASIAFYRDFLGLRLKSQRFRQEAPIRGQCDNAHIAAGCGTA